MKKSISIVTALTLVIVATSCSTTMTHRITAEHRDESWRPRPLENVLVIGVYYETYRAFAEDIFVSEMANNGVNAGPGFEVLPDLNATDDEDDLWQVIDETGFDAVLTIITVARDQGFDHDKWWDDYGLWIVLGESSEKTGRVLVEEYSEEEFHVDIGLFDSKTRKPIWNATTNSFGIPAIGEDDIKILADFVVLELAQRGFVK